MRVCARCESLSIVERYDAIEKRHYEACLMCGSEKFKEVEMGSPGKCKIAGCGKNQVSNGLCYKHYHKEHGEPYKPKTHRGEKTKEQAKVTVPVDVKVKVSADDFPHLPDDLPGVYKRTDFTDHLESLIAHMEKQLDALRIVLSIIREAA